MLLSLLAGGACSGPDLPPLQQRAQRYGILHDLLLYQRPDADGGPFFLDRFETTRADWYAYRHALGHDVEPPSVDQEALPLVDVDLHQARAYAQWRFCRLPRRDEWRYAATARGGYLYPWGDHFRAEWVNSWELGLDAPTPVGTFESGRAEGGAYDLLGNVAEWTESVADLWFAPIGGRDRYATAYVRLRGTPALAPWWLPGVPPPLAWQLCAFGASLPRLVVGGHYRARLFADATLGVDHALPAEALDGTSYLWERAPSEHGDTVGVRLAADPLQALVALLDEPARPTSAEVEEVRAFLRRPGNDEVLAAALPRAMARVDAPGPLAAVLRTELAAP